MNIEDLMPYKDKLEKASRLRIVSPAPDEVERETIQEANGKPINWRCSGCVINAYIRAYSQLKKYIATQKPVTGVSTDKKKARTKSK